MNKQDLMNEQATMAMHLLNAERNLKAAQEAKDKWQKEYDRATAQLELMQQIENQGLQIVNPEQPNPKAEDVPTAQQEQAED